MGRSKDNSKRNEKAVMHFISYGKVASGNSLSKKNNHQSFRRTYSA